MSNKIWYLDQSRNLLDKPFFFNTKINNIRSSEWGDHQFPYPTNQVFTRLFTATDPLDYKDNTNDTNIIYMYPNYYIYDNVNNTVGLYRSQQIINTSYYLDTNIIVYSAVAHISKDSDQVTGKGFNKFKVGQNIIIGLFKCNIMHIENDNQMQVDVKFPYDLQCICITNVGKHYAGRSSVNDNILSGINTSYTKELEPGMILMISNILIQVKTIIDDKKIVLQDPVQRKIKSNLLFSPEMPYIANKIRKPSIFMAEKNNKVVSKKALYNTPSLGHIVYGFFGNNNVQLFTSYMVYGSGFFTFMYEENMCPVINISSKYVQIEGKSSNMKLLIDNKLWKLYTLSMEGLSINVPYTFTKGKSIIFSALNQTTYIQICYVEDVKYEDIYDSCFNSIVRALKFDLEWDGQNTILHYKWNNIGGTSPLIFLPPGKVSKFTSSLHTQDLLGTMNTINYDEWSLEYPGLVKLWNDPWLHNYGENLISDEIFNNEYQQLIIYDKKMMLNNIFSGGQFLFKASSFCLITSRLKKSQQYNDILSIIKDLLLA